MVVGWGLDYVPCFRGLMYVLFVRGGCGGVGGANGEECCRELLEEGG